VSERPGGPVPDAVRVHVAAFADLDAATAYRLWQLRVDVFVVEQQCAYPELDGRDLEASTRHVWLERDGAPVAYLRVLQEPGGCRIGRVCVAAQARGAGLADALMRRAMEEVGPRRCVLHGQSYLADWYARWGFAVTGPEFLDDGIPHVPMERAASEEDLGRRLDRVLVHGRQPARVRIVDYDPGWPERFRAERDRIVHALGPRALAVHHIGSTAVPGLAAKDRVDVCVEVADPDDEGAYLPDLFGAGYALRVVEPGHRCLARADDEEPATNVHVYAEGDAEVTANLRFRDQLRRDEGDRRRYEELKRSLAEREWPDVNHYADAKGGLIREILARARDSR
jgi:ElaA protein